MGSCTCGMAQSAMNHASWLSDPFVLFSILAFLLAMLIYKVFSHEN